MRYCKSTIFQANHNEIALPFLKTLVVCDTAKVRFSKQITTGQVGNYLAQGLFAILQKYDFPSKSQHWCRCCYCRWCCLRYCKSTIFQANHNTLSSIEKQRAVVCDTAKVRFSKQITTIRYITIIIVMLFAILQKYDFPSKSQRNDRTNIVKRSCLRYCKSTIFQANHNDKLLQTTMRAVVCDTAKVRFSKQITTDFLGMVGNLLLFAILQKYDFPSKSQLTFIFMCGHFSCLRYCKSTIFQANHNAW